MLSSVAKAQAVADQLMAGCRPTRNVESDTRDPALSGDADVDDDGLGRATTLCTSSMCMYRGVCGATTCLPIHTQHSHCSDAMRVGMCMY